MTYYNAVHCSFLRASTLTQILKHIPPMNMKMKAIWRTLRPEPGDISSSADGEVEHYPYCNKIAVKKKTKKNRRAWH